MTPKRLGRRIAPRKLGLGQGRVDFLVADVVQENRLPALAAAQFRDQVMQALRNPRRDRATTKRTVRDIFGQSPCLFRPIPSY